MKIVIIAALAQNRGIGFGNAIPWRLSADLKRFKSLTTGHYVVMGRKTFESIGKPLPNRISLVVSRQEGYRAEGCRICDSLEQAIAIAQHDGGAGTLYIIGGGQIYEQALPLAHRLELTEVSASPQADAFFPEFKKEEWIEVFREEHAPDEKNQYPFAFVTLERKQPLF
jgi:dihydrofolate reductase